LLGLITASVLLGHEGDAGDMWDHTAVAADSKLVVSLVVDKRTREQTQALVNVSKLTEARRISSPL